MQIARSQTSARPGAARVLTIRRPSAPQWAGLALLWLGGVAAARWLFQLDFLSSAIPGFSEMGIVSPMLFVGAGLALCLVRKALPGNDSWAARAAVCASIAALLVFPSLMLLEHLSGIHLGVDFVHAGTVPSATSPYPGRMSPNACFGFLSAGLSLLLAMRPNSRRARRASQALLCAVAAIGLAGCLGYFLRLEALYTLAAANRLTLPVAYGLVILAIGLWFLTEQNATHRASFERHERRISQRAVVVVSLVALASGVAGFATIEKSYEENQSKTLLLTATTNAASIANALEVGLWFPRTLATRPTVTQTLQRLSVHPDDPAARDFLAKVGDSFLSAGITTVRFYNSAGTEVGASGSVPLPARSAVIPLAAAYPRATLLWKQGYFLHVEEPVVVDGQRVGEVITEQRLPLLAQLLEGIRDAASSADGLICGRLGDQAFCGPSRLRPEGFAMPLVDAYGKPVFPFAGASADHTGATFTKDLRGRPILAAFAPAGKFGLGLIVKQDADVLYAPLRDRVHLLGVLLLIVVGAGTMAIRGLVKPLVSEVVAAERRTNAILESSNDAFIGINQAGKVTQWNGEAERTFGWSADQAIGKDLGELIIPDEQRAAHAAGLGHFANTGTGPVINRRVEVAATHRDGHRMAIELSVAALATEDGFVAHAFARDISKRLAAQLRLAASEKTLKAITDNLPVLISYIDKDHTVTFANKTLTDWTGMAASTAIGLTMEEVLGKDLYGQRVAHLNRALGGERVEFEWVSHALGVNRNVQTTYIPDVSGDGVVAGVYSLSHDITNTKLVEQRLDQLARIDPLTGLPNRREFLERLENAMARTRRSKRAMALVFLDVDRFKDINDSLGHGVGDQVLQEFAGRLNSCTRVTDTVARLAGDEFVVILEGLADISQVKTVCEKMGEAIRIPMRCGDARLTITASLGVAFYEGDGGTTQALVARADRALYRAKAAGRDTFAATNFSTLP